MTQPSNTELYSKLKDRMQKYREDHTTVSNRVIDATVKVEKLHEENAELTRKHDELEQKFAELDAKIHQIVSEQVSQQVEPLFNELIADIENLTTDVKILKQQPRLSSVPTTDLETASMKSLDTARTKAPLSLRRKV